MKEVQLSDMLHTIFLRFQAYVKCCVFWCRMFSKKFVISYLNCLPNGFLSTINCSKFLSLTAYLRGTRKIASLILDLVMWKFLLQKFKCLSILVHTLTKFIIIPSLISIKGKNIFFGYSSVSCLMFSCGMPTWELWQSNLHKYSNSVYYILWRTSFMLSCD